MSSDLLSVRAQLGIVGDAFSQPGTIYLDNAATTPTPLSVANAVRDALLSTTSAGRGSHRLAGQALHQLETARQQIADWIGASADDIAFVSGSTSASNLIARGLIDGASGQSIKVALCADDHQAFVGPWRDSAPNATPLELVTYEVEDTGAIDRDSCAEASADANVVLVSAVNNVYGAPNFLDKIRQRIGPDPLLIVDAAQWVGHRQLDVQSMQADAVFFSAHKMFGPTGVGVLWSNARFREQVHPPVSGGRSASDSAAAQLFERGTCDLAPIVGLAAACAWLDEIGMPLIMATNEVHTTQLRDSLHAIDGVAVLTGSQLGKCRRGVGLLTIRLDRHNAHDVAFALDSLGVCVRAGGMCAGAHDRWGEMLRFSAHFYNTESEISYATEMLAKIVSNG